MRRTSLVFAFVLVGLVLGPGSIQAQSAPGPPTGTAVVATAVTLQVTWSAPAELGGSAVTAYHVRHIESAADATNDDNWTVAMDAWGTGGGDLAYTIEGLLDSTSYKVGVRAVNAQGPSSWTDALTISTPDHGHSTGQATPLPVGGSLRGQIDTGDEGDLFKFTLPTAGLYWVFTTGELDTKGRLGDAYNDLRETQTDGKTPRDMRQFSLIHDYQARTYHIRIRAEVEGATGTYTVHLRSVAEPGDTKLAAQEVTLGQATGAILRVPGEVDYFRFTLTETTDVAIESAGWVHTRAQLLEEDETEIAAAQGGYIARPSHGDNYFQGFMMRRTLSAGSYLLKVSSVPEDVFGFLDPVSPTGAYFLLIEEPADPGSSRATATPLALRHTVAGRISSASDEDYYSLTVDKETYVTITAVPYGTSFPLVPTFFDADGTDLNAYVIRRQDYGYEGRREAFAIVTQVAPGTYYVRVKAPDGGTGGPYVLSAWDTDYGQDPVKRCTDITNLQSDPLYGDPLYGCQWHLKNTRQLGIGASEDINVEGVWETNKGEGINVAVVDTMVQPNHEDLVGTPDDPLDLDDDKLGRFDTARSHDYYDRGLETFEPHGTNVAGLIAARANDIGVRGVAPEATIYSFNLLAQHATDAQRADAFTRHMDVTAISNHSYGAVNGGIPSTVPGVWRMALERAVTEGYDGKGLFITWAAGNDGDYGGWASLDERTTSYAVTPVCAIDIYDKRPVWSNRGPNLWVCAPGHDLTSTITANRYTRRFAGTSGATPIVAGVAALVRAADPDLTWRDVKLILANSARKNDPAHGRLPGALKYGSTSERYSFSYDYGFGAVDAGAAVALAKNWTELPTLRKLEVSSDRLDMAIPDAILGPNNTNMVGMEISANLTPNNNYIEFIEFIELEVSITHRKARNLFIRLDSPSTTTSQITVPYWGGGGRSFLDILTGTNWPALQADMVNPFTFGTARHLGESVDGEWTLRIRDDDPDARGTLHSWKLTFYGHGYTPGFPTLRAFDSGERIAIRWDPPEDTGATPITSYDLRYIRANAPDKSDELLWTVVTGFPDPNRTNNYVRGLLPGRKYDLQLRAVSATGAGPWSAVSRAGPHPERPRAPAIGEIVPRDRGLGVTWSAPAENGGTFITRYDLRVRSNPTGENNPGNWREFNVWSRGDLTARISGLTNNVSHDVQVRARNRIGVGPWSTEVVTGTPAVQNQPPSFPPAETGTRAILEDPLVERNVGAPVSAVDPDTGDSLTYFLSSGDEFFRIDSKTGQLLTRKALDRETVPSHVLIVDVSDSKDSSDDPDAVVDDTIVVTVTVEDVNEAPKVMGETSVARDENSDLPIDVYQATDPEGGATSWVELLGADGGHFELDEFGELSFAEPPDFEARADSGGDNVYNVIVRASDDGTPPLIGSLAVTVTVTPVNEPPAITGDRAPSIEEEGATAVGTYGATDPESATIAWLPLDGADKDKFDFTPSNGRLAFKAAPDFEDADRGGDNEYSLTLGVSAGGDTTPFDVEVTVTNKEEPGTLELSTTQPQADAGYTATLGDPDGVQSTTWTWERSTSGSDPWSAVSGAFDRTTTSVYTPDTDDVGYFLRVTAAYTDGHGPNKSRVRVSANTVKAAPVTNDPPSFDEPTPTRSIAENAGANARVGDPVTATDPDAGDVITYELSGSDLFTIDSNSGLIRVKTRESLDYDDPAKRTQTVTVKASDSSNASATVQVTIEVTDVNEPPDADADAPRSFDEDTAITIDVLANDSDPEQEQSELLLTVFNSGPNAPRNGTVTVNEPANAGENRTITYEPKLNYHGADTFTYQVRDTGSPPLSSTASVSIEVDAVNDAPVFPPSETGARSVPESAKAGANVGSAVTATDVDNAMLTYRLSGADASSFDIDSDGQITVGMGVTFNAAMKDEYAVTVTADDGRGEAAMVEVTITVTAGPVLPPVIIITGGGGGGGGRRRRPHPERGRLRVDRRPATSRSSTAATTGPPACGRTARRCGSPTTRTAPATRSTPTTAPAASAWRSSSSRCTRRTARRAASGPTAVSSGSPTAAGNGSSPTTSPRGSASRSASSSCRANATAMRAASGRTGRRCGCWTAAPTRSSPTASRAANCSPSTPSTPPTTTPAASGPTASPSGSPTTGRSASSPTACPCCRMQRRTRRGGRGRRQGTRARPRRGVRQAEPGQQQQPARHLVRRRRDVRRRRERRPRLQLQHAGRHRRAARLAHAQRRRHRGVRPRRERSTRPYVGGRRDGDDGRGRGDAAPHGRHRPARRRRRRRERPPGCPPGPRRDHRHRHLARRQPEEDLPRAVPRDSVGSGPRSLAALPARRRLRRLQPRRVRGRQRRGVGQLRGEPGHRGPLRPARGRLRLSHPRGAGLRERGVPRAVPRWPAAHHAADRREQRTALGGPVRGSRRRWAAAVAGVPARRRRRGLQPRGLRGRQRRRVGGLRAKRGHHRPLRPERG